MGCRAECAIQVARQALILQPLEASGKKKCGLIPARKALQPQPGMPRAPGAWSPNKLNL